MPIRQLSLKRRIYRLSCAHCELHHLIVVRSGCALGLRPSDITFTGIFDERVAAANAKNQGANPKDAHNQSKALNEPRHLGTISAATKNTAK